MSALAEPTVDVPAGDRLARRNALVLAVTQALAGGNNMVLVATAGITGLGLAIIIVAAVIGIAGISLWHFWIGLALLGVGWNFAFIGATTMVTQCHRPNERNKVQAFNDFLVFGSMAIGSFSSGALLASFGWATVNEVVFPVVLAAVALLMWGPLQGRLPIVVLAQERLEVADIGTRLGWKTQKIDRRHKLERRRIVGPDVDGIRIEVVWVEIGEDRPIGLVVELFEQAAQAS